MTQAPLSGTLTPLALSKGPLVTPPRNGAASTQEMSLVLGLIFGKHFVGIEDLHYGYWEDGLEVNIRNLPQAQQAFTDMLLSHIPAGTRSILDVGTGGGHLARTLLDRGFEVHCVSPTPGLTRMAREQVGTRAEIFPCPFEAFTPQRAYDLVLFSESFQYIPTDLALQNAARCLKPGGHMLICDFFRVDPSIPSPIGGGTRLPRFEKFIAASPFELITKQDVTDRVSPTIDIVNSFNQDCLKPAYEVLSVGLRQRHPWLSKIFRFVFRGRIRKFENKQFSGTRTGENFRKHKSYRLLLYRRGENAPQAA